MKDYQAVSILHPTVVITFSSFDEENAKYTLGLMGLKSEHYFTMSKLFKLFFRSFGTNKHYSRVTTLTNRKPYKYSLLQKTILVYTTFMKIHKVYILEGAYNHLTQLKAL